MTNIDAIDRKIIEYLQEDGSASNTSLAEALGVSEQRCAGAGPGWSKTM
jgi:DNA-binding Lrp family transcriptional regulator